MVQSSNWCMWCCKATTVHLSIHFQCSIWRVCKSDVYIPSPLYWDTSNKLNQCCMTHLLTIPCSHGHWSQHLKPKPALCATHTLWSGPVTHPPNFIPGGILKHKLKWGLEDPWHQTNIYACLCVYFICATSPLQGILLKSWGGSGTAHEHCQHSPCPLWRSKVLWEKTNWEQLMFLLQWLDCHNVLHLISPSLPFSYPSN